MSLKVVTGPVEGSPGNHETGLERLRDLAVSVVTLVFAPFGAGALAASAPSTNAFTRASKKAQILLADPGWFRP